MIVAEKPTCKDLIKKFMAAVPNSWLAVHEIQVFGHSQTSIDRRLRELRKDGEVVSRTREGKAYMEWRTATLDKQMELI